MKILFTPEQEAFLKARFETNDIEPIVQKVLNDWLNNLVEEAYNRVPANKIQIATADIISQKEK